MENVKILNPWKLLLYISINSAVTGHRPSGIGRNFSVVSCYRQLWASDQGFLSILLGVKIMEKKIKEIRLVSNSHSWLLYGIPFHSCPVSLVFMFPVTSAVTKSLPALRMRA